MTIILAWRQMKQRFFLSIAFDSHQKLVHQIDSVTICASSSLLTLVCSSEDSALLYLTSDWSQDVTFLLDFVLGRGSLVHSFLLFIFGLLRRMLTASAACRNPGSPGYLPRIFIFKGGISPLCASHIWSQRNEVCRICSLLLRRAFMCPTNLSSVLRDVSPSQLLISAHGFPCVSVPSHQILQWIPCALQSTSPPRVHT